MGRKMLSNHIQVRYQIKQHLLTKNPTITILKCINPLTQNALKIKYSNTLRKHLSVQAQGDLSKIRGLFTKFKYILKL